MLRISVLRSRTHISIIRLQSMLFLSYSILIYCEVQLYSWSCFYPSRIEPYSEGNYSIVQFITTMLINIFKIEFCQDETKFSVIMAFFFSMLRTMMYRYFFRLSVDYFHFIVYHRLVISPSISGCLVPCLAFSFIATISATSCLPFLL